jgi:hypothetical protein
LKSFQDIERQAPQGSRQGSALTKSYFFNAADYGTCRRKNNEEFMDRDFAAASWQRHTGGSLKPLDRGQNRRPDKLANH